MCVPWARSSRCKTRIQKIDLRMKSVTIVIKDKSEEGRRKNAMKDEKSKITAVAIEKMIDFYQGNLRDIEHFLKVWAYAKT